MINENRPTLPEETVSRFSPRNRVVVLAGILIVAFQVCWWQRWAVASFRDTEAVLATQLSQMQADAKKIESLRTAPQVALSRVRANEELLQQVEDALEQADIHRTHWRSSTPQPVIRADASDYRRHATRVRLENISIKQLVAFAWHLEKDPTLGVSGLHVMTSVDGNAQFDVDVTIGYLEYAPRVSSE